MSASKIESIEDILIELGIGSNDKKNFLKQILEKTKNISEIEKAKQICEKLGIDYKKEINKIKQEKGSKLVEKIETRKVDFNKIFVKKLEKSYGPDDINSLFLYDISLKARQPNGKLVLSKDLMKVDYLNDFINELSKTLTNLIKTYSAKSKKILVLDSKTYAKGYYNKNRIAKLKEELIERKYNITDKAAIKKRGLEYLKKIPTLKKRNEISEIILKLLKCEGSIDQKQITDARIKRYTYLYYKKGSLEETLEEKTNGSRVDYNKKELTKDIIKTDELKIDYNKKELTKDLIKTINDDKKEPRKDLIKTSEDNKKKPYESLIELINVEVEKYKTQGYSKEKIKEFIVETLATRWGEYNIKSTLDAINVKRPFAKEYFEGFENLNKDTRDKAKEIVSKIDNGTLIPGQAYEEYIGFLEMEGYPEGRITGAISSGKRCIMLYVCQKLQHWIRSKMKNKKHYDKNSLENGLKIEEPIKISSVTNLFDKGVDLKLYQKKDFRDVLKERAAIEIEYVDVIIWEKIKELS